MRKLLSRVSILALTGVGACAGVVGCSGNDSSTTAETSPSDGKSGEIGLALDVGGGVTINTASYTIVGPNGFTKTGTIDLSAATAFSATIGGIPVGNGYSISLSATATDGTTNCGGSATFNVTARTTTNVTVSLDCHQAPTTGSVGINGTTNICPVIDALSANPSQVNVGSTIALSGAAHDSDSGPSPVTYKWTATSGTFDNATSANPVFTCTDVGVSTITLVASDGDTTANCNDSLTTTVTCSMSVSGVVSTAAFAPGSPTEPNIGPSYYAGAKVCVDANANGSCDAGELGTTTDASGKFSLLVTTPSALIADIRATATNTASGITNPSRNVYRAPLAQVSEQGAKVVLSPLSSEVLRNMEANGTDYATERLALATRLGVLTTEVLSDPSTLSGASKTAVLRESHVLNSRFRYAVTKLDRGDLYPDALAVPGGNPELTGLAGVTPATATTVDTRAPITFKQAEQAAFAVEGIPRYDAIFIVMLENKSTQAMLNSAFAPKINGYLREGNQAASYYATGNPSEPNYTALGGADDFGITDDSQWNCDATGPNAVKDLPIPDKTVPGLQNSPFTTTCTQSAAVNHNITGKPNLFTAMNQAGMTWRTYNESMNPGQDRRTDSIADNAVVAPDNVYAPGTLAGNTAQIGNANLLLPLPAGLYKTKHHPGMAYQDARSEPDFNYSNRTLGGGQWDSVLLNTSVYSVPANYDLDQFGTDLNNGGIGALNFVIPDQCDDMHGITVQGTVPPSTSKVTASDCSSVSNNVPVATGGNILARGDKYVDYLVKKIKASPVWMNPQKKVAIVLMFDEGNATAPDINSCCGWKAGKTSVNAPLIQNSDGTYSKDLTVNNYKAGNQGHGKSIFGILTNQASAPKGIQDNDVYSHFSFVRTLQDMFLLSDPAKDGSYMNRSKYTEKFIAQNILNLPEYAGSADTHFDAVRPMNHSYVIPATYTQKPTADDTRPLQVGADATQTNIWAIK
ncbi:MAG: phosphoesterase [Pseudomonadota bacterium]